MQKNCIDEAELARFVCGDLEENDLQRIASHVDSCEPCQDTVVGLVASDDTFIDNIRSAGSAPRPTEEGALQFGIRRFLSSLRSRSSQVPAEEVVVGEMPELVGPYRIEQRLGRGGMGHVYRATHERLNRTVALKILPERRWSNERAVSRFQREIQATGGLDHPNIVRASDAGEHQGMHYLVMEFVDGLDLARLANRLGPLPVAEVCEIARQCAAGLQHAHEEGLVHRDIKPSNLMVASSYQDSSAVNLKILDLGLALLGGAHAEDDCELTTVGTLMGTLDYMSPEQATDSHAVDHRTDIYSLGATMFKLLSGRAPYADPRHNTLMKKMTALATKSVPSIATLRDDLPAGLAEIVDRMMSRDPDERFPSAEEVATALAPYSEDADVSRVLRRALSTEDPPEPNTRRAPLTKLFAEDETATPLVAASGGRGKTGILVALAFAFIAGALGIVFYLQTNVGELKISSTDPNATVTISQNDKVVKTLRITSGQESVRLRVGKYDLRVTGNANVVVLPPKVEISRGDKKDAIVSGTPELADSSDQIAEFDTGDALSPFEWSLEDLAVAEQHRNQAKLDELNLHAQAALEVGKLKEALEKYDEALQVQPSFQSAYGKAKTLAKLGWADQSVAAFQAAAQMGVDPSEDEHFFVDYASACLDDNQYDVAVEVLRTGINTLGLTNANLWFHLGFAQREYALNQQWATVQTVQEGLDSALKAFRRALQLDPDHADAKAAIAKMETERRREEEYKKNKQAEQERIAKLVKAVVDSGAYEETSELVKLIYRSRDFSRPFVISDGLQVKVYNSLPDREIEGYYPVSEGFAQLGPPYGRVDVHALTVNEATVVIGARLSKYIKDPVITVSAPLSVQQQAQLKSLSRDETDTKRSESTMSAVYQGHDYAYWLDALRNDRDPDVLSNAVAAVGFLGAERSEESASGILAAMRNAAGSTVSVEAVAVALAALDHQSVVDAAFNEIKFGNARSRRFLKSLLSVGMRSDRSDWKQLRTVFEEHAVELAKLRSSEPAGFAEREAKAEFLQLLIRAFSADPLQLRDELARYCTDMKFVSELLPQRLVETVPDIPQVWKASLAQLHYRSVDALLAGVDVEHVRPFALELARTLQRAYEDGGVFRCLNAVNVIGRLGSDGIAALPVLEKILDHENEADEEGAHLFACITAYARLHPFAPTGVSDRDKLLAELRTRISREKSEQHEIATRRAQISGDHVDAVLEQDTFYQECVKAIAEIDQARRAVSSESPTESNSE